MVTYKIQSLRGSVWEKWEKFVRHMSYFHDNFGRSVHNSSNLSMLIATKIQEQIKWSFEVWNNELKWTEMYKKNASCYVLKNIYILLIVEVPSKIGHMSIIIWLESKIGYLHGSELPAAYYKVLAKGLIWFGTVLFNHWGSVVVLILIFQFIWTTSEWCVVWLIYYDTPTPKDS